MRVRPVKKDKAWPASESLKQMSRGNINQRFN
jgi:hypothetical protein